MAVLSLLLVGLLLISISLNVYLGWELAGLEVSVSRQGARTIEEIALPIPTEALAAIPTNTPQPPSPANTSTPSAPTESPLDTQLGTMSAIATEVAAASQALDTPVPVLTPTATATPTPIPTAVAIGTPASSDTSSAVESTDDTSASTQQTDSPSDESEAAGSTAQEFGLTSPQTATN